MSRKTDNKKGRAEKVPPLRGGMFFRTLLRVERAAVEPPYERACGRICGLCPQI